MPKVKVNLYLDEELTQRFRSALEATGSTLSAYVNHAMAEDVEVMELMAVTGDRRQVAQLVKEKSVDKLTGAIADEYAKLADFMRMIQDESQGKEHND